MTKKTRTTFFAALVAAVLCAGTVSARQLRSESKTFTCGGTCSATRPCATPCVCSFTTPFTAFCTTKLAGVVPPKK
jgi:hypothetical protein